MKLFPYVCTALLSLSSTSVMAMGGSLAQGKDFSNINLELGKSSSGLYVDGNWTKNTDDGSQYTGAGIGYNIGLGPVMFNAGIKAVYLNPKHGDEGTAFPFGGGVKIDLPLNLALYGESYVAPDSMANSVKNYVEADGGISWSPLGPLTIKVGYRYAGVDGKEGHPKNTMIDGPYLGAGLTF